MSDVAQAGRVVVVTGAGIAGGIGPAIVRRLVTDGDHVAVIDLDPEAAEATAESVTGLSGSARGYGCDVGVRDAVMDTFARIQQEMGPAWGLVNCAASGPFDPIEDMGEEAWNRGLAVVLSGTLWCCQAVFPAMKERGAGRIVNFGSEASDDPVESVNVNYIAAKGGVRSLTRGLAWQWGRHGITVNTLWPVAASATFKVWAESAPEDYQALVEATPLRRVGDPLEDIAPVVQFLLSEGSRYMTGATVAVNGGRAMP